MKAREIYQQLKKTAFVIDGINSTQARDQCLEYANRLINLQFPLDAGVFFNSCSTVSFTRRTLSNVVSAKGGFVYYQYLEMLKTVERRYMFQICNVSKLE